MVVVILMKKRLFVIVMILWGCGQNPQPNPEPTKTPAKSEPAKAASEPAPVSEPAKSAAASTPASIEAPKPETAPQRDLVSAVTANGVEDAQGMGDPEKATAPAAKTFKNAKLLGEISGSRFMASMQSMSVNLGKDCEFCHNEEDFSSDANKKKAVSRNMMEMSFAINRDYFDNKMQVSCYTCHRGEEEPGKSPELAPEISEPKQVDEAKDQPAGKFYTNVQILKDIHAKELKPIMKKFNAALGVNCEFCHVKGKFESDDKPTKKTAREMLKMSMALNTTYFSKEKTPAITCDTCHRGAKDPAVNVGPKIMVAATVTGQTSWSAIFGVAKWPTLPKTRGEFRTALEPIPENQALAGRLLGTDTGELGHLPPGEYNLCGFALPANKEDDTLKADRPVTCQAFIVAASPDTQTAKIELPAP